MFSTVVVATSSDKELAVVIAGNIVEARVCRHPPSTASSCVCVCACVCVHVVFFLLSRFRVFAVREVLRGVAPSFCTREVFRITLVAAVECRQ